MRKLFDRAILKINKKTNFDIIYNIVSIRYYIGGDLRMEPQETIYCYENKKEPRKRNCLGIIAVILLTALSFVIGLLVGAATAVLVLLSLPAIIVLAIILGLLLVITLILIFCNRNKDKKEKHECYR